MRLPKSARAFSALAIATLIAMLTSCATFEKQAFDRTRFQTPPRTIAIVAFPDPEEYSVTGAAQIPGGPALYAFGAIGGAILGIAEGVRAKSQAMSLSSSLLPHRPHVTTTLTKELDIALRASGLRTMTLAPPPLADDQRSFDYSRVSVDADAILEAVVTVAGYRQIGEAIRPTIALRARLLGPKGAPIYYSELIVYGERFSNQGAVLYPDPRYTFKSLEALYADGALAAEGLRAGLPRIAARIADDLR
jgi:hypothetical protein